MAVIAQQAAFEFAPMGKLEQQFWQFHHDHPEVFTTLVH